MKNGGVHAFFEILSPGADKPRARDKAKVNMDQTFQKLQQEKF